MTSTSRLFPGTLRLRKMQLHSDLFPEFGCDGELIEIPGRCTDAATVRYCAVCWTEFSWSLRPTRDG